MRPEFKVIFAIILAAYLYVMTIQFVAMYGYAVNDKVNVAVSDIEQRDPNFRGGVQLEDAQGNTYRILEAAGGTYYTFQKDVTIATDENGTIYEPWQAYVFGSFFVYGVIAPLMVAYILYGIKRRNKAQASSVL